MKRGSKFGNIRTEYDGHVFDSLWERDVYVTLKMRQMAGEISGLEVHKEFVILDGFRDKQKKWHEPVVYEADFSYVEKGQPVVADAKGVRTAVFNLKYKMFLTRYPHMRFEIVMKPRKRGRKSG
jgi:hypothetical protein